MREDGPKSSGNGGNFEMVAKSARVDTDHNTRDARLARLAGDPFRLRDAIAEANRPAGLASNQTAVLPASDSIAMIRGGGPQPSVPQLKALLPYQDDFSAREAKTFDRLERLHDDGIDKPDLRSAELFWIPPRSKFVICLLGIVAATAILLFAS